MQQKFMFAAASALLTIGAAADAAVTVKIYTGQNVAAANATIAQAAGLVADATVSVGAINFTNAPGNNSAAFTVGAFLNNPAGLSAAVANHVLNNTYFLFTGSTFLKSGANSFVIPHDDGLQLKIDGIAGFIVDQPGPTSPVSTAFNVNAPESGLYNFTLSYGETAGGPAVLRFDVNGAPVGRVPEPATWAMMVTGFGLVGFSVRRRTKMITA